MVRRTRGYRPGMDDLGRPIAYLVLPVGVPVYDDTDDRVGNVAQVLADERTDVFHGLVVTTPGGSRFAGREQIAELFERGVRLAVRGDRLRAAADDPVAAQAVDDGDGPPG
jgi:hypothetical protein